MEITFHIFHVEDPNDVLEVRDKETGSLLTQIKGGQDPPNTVTYPTGSLRLTFTSDGARSGQGFALTYRGKTRWVGSPLQGAQEIGGG